MESACNCRHSLRCHIGPLPLQKVQEGPPGDWKLVETPKDTHLTLTRQHGNEKVVLDIMVNDQVGSGVVQHC